MADTLLTVQLQSIKEAQQRARKAFFLALVVSCVVMLFSFNLTLSQDANAPRTTDYTDEMGDRYLHGTPAMDPGSAESEELKAIRERRDLIKPGEEYKLRMKWYMDRWTIQFRFLE